MKFSSLVFGIPVVVMLAFGCGNGKNEHTENVDSLFLGFSFGMERKDFFQYCWEMNRKRIFTHGPTNQNVEYQLPGLDAPVKMRFYPAFYDEKIYQMAATFSYDSWSPWNKKYSGDSLITEVLPLFKEWYGNDFESVNHPEQGKVYYKIDKHRRINLFVKDEQYVQAVFTDLRAEKKIKDGTIKQN
jgi:hypothetical protein